MGQNKKHLDLESRSKQKLQKPEQHKMASFKLHQFLAILNMLKRLEKK